MTWYLTSRKELLANQYRNVQPVSRQVTTGWDRLMYPRCHLDTGCKSTTSNLKPWVALWLTLTRFCCLRTALRPALKGNPPGIKDNTLSLMVIPVRRGLKSGTRNKKRSGRGCFYCWIAVHCVGIRDAMHAWRPCWLATAVSSLPEWKKTDVPVNDFQNKSPVRRSFPKCFRK